jgi:hypothetical protein
VLGDIQIAEHFKSRGDGGGEFRRKRRKSMEYAIYPQANSQAIVTGFNMNIGCALAQGLFEDLLTCSTMLAEASTGGVRVDIPGVCSRLSIWSWLQHSISILFCVAKRSASISSGAGSPRR